MAVWNEIQKKRKKRKNLGKSEEKKKVKLVSVENFI